MYDQQKTKRQRIEEPAKPRRRATTMKTVEKPLRKNAQQRRTNTAKQEGNRRFSTLLSNLPGMAYRCNNDANWTMEFISEGCVLLTGYKQQAFVGNKEIAYADIIHPDDRQLVWDHVQAAIAESRHFQVEYRIRTASGQEKWIWEQGVAVYSDNGEMEALEGMMTDITKRVLAEAELKKAHDVLEEKVKERTNELTTANKQLRHEIEERQRTEEALRQSRDELQCLIEACPDAVVISDLTGKILYASRQTWNLLGLPEQHELVGQSVFDYTVENDRRRLKKDIPTLVEEGIRRRAECTVLRPDGEMVPTEASSAVIRDAQGQPKAVIAVIRDITERKQADEALRQEHRTLKHLFQSSDHERQVIAYEIHDGLAQQLAGTIMQLETYSYQKNIMPEEATKSLDTAITMLRQAHKEARRLISGVRPPVLDESGVVIAIAHLLDEKRNAKGPIIESCCNVKFDRLAPIVENAIYRIVQEGLTNACEHSKSERIRVELVQHGDLLRIKIQDWGTGFTPTTTDANRFGLASIRERARLLGGHATIESVPQQGTCLSVELPLVVRE